MKNNNILKLSEYVKKTSDELSKAGGDPNTVYKPSISDAMIECHNIANEYAVSRKLKNPPIPIAISNKSSDDEAKTMFKFDPSINVASLKKAVNKLELKNVDIIEYNSSINMNIHTEFINK